MQHAHLAEGNKGGNMTTEIKMQLLPLATDNQSIQHAPEPANALDQPFVDLRQMIINQGEKLLENS